MTEAEWLACDKPDTMLMYLRGQVGARKLRLFFCATLRRPAVWPLLTSKSSRRAVEECERYADGLAGVRDLIRVRTSAHSAWGRVGPMKAAQYAVAELAHDCCWLDAYLLRHGIDTFWRQIAEGRVAFPADLVREIFGNPFRSPSLEPVCRTPQVVALALAAYEERSLPGGELECDRLKILSDALEEAGCTDLDLLAHLRQPAPHVRGCWALDLVLGRT
jgi:hypothetical protein